MKKIKLFLSLLMLIAFSVGNVWGADESVTFSDEGYSNQEVVESYAGTNFSIAFNKGTNSNAPKYFTSGTAIRAYGGNTFTVSSSTKTIAKIELGFGSSDGSNAITTDVNTYDNGTWTGSATSITFTIGGTSGNRRLASVAVTYEEGGDTPSTPTCATPTFDPEDGEKFDESIDVEINAEDGATIYYTTDGNAPTTSSSAYSTALHFTETTTLKAMAVKAGSNNSAVATATYTKMVTVPGYAIDFESELDAYVDWEFSNIGIRTSTITAHGDTYYGSNVNDNGNATTTAAIKTKAKVATPGVLTFYISKESKNTTASSWKAQVSADGSEWTEVETFDAKSMSKGAWNECTADLSEYSNVYVRIYYEGSNAIRAIDDIELAEAAAVAKPAISGETPFLTSTMVTLTQAEADHIYYTTNGNEPTTSSTEYTVPFELNATATVKAIAVKGSSESAVAEATFTKITPLTVAEAIAAIPNVDDVVNSQYVAGIVCTAGTSVNASGQMTYYISADGSEGTRLQIYLGKNINNTAFSSASDLAIGDRVVVFGQLKNYKGTYEMNSGNYLVSKEGPAVATPVFDPNGGGFMGETDVTITCATDGSTIYYTLDGTNPTKLSTLYEGAIHLDATTTITAIAYVGEESSLVVAKTFTLTAPMTVAEALAALDSEDPINNVAVAGIISTAPTANPSSGKLTFFISDDGSASDELEVYKGFGIGGASFSDKTDLQVGDEVTVFGNLTIYNTTKEFAEGSRLMAFNRLQVDVESINLTESTAEVEEGKTVTLHASVVPANATNKTIVWSVQSGDTYASVDQNGVVTGIAAGEAVIRAASDEDATIFAECTVTVTAPTPLSPWATTYTSNVTMAHTGSGVDNGTITIGTDDPYLLVKAGASSSTGTIVVTVPTGTTDLHFHAFAWGGKTAKIELAGVENASVSEFDLAGEAGASGSGNDFTLQGDPVDQYFHVSFDAVAAETEITFSKATGSADNRFFFYGVNQEGGLILESISVSGTAAALEYNDGDHFSPAGLVVTGHYSNASTAPITEGIVWAFDPDPLTEGTESVSVIATAGGKTSTAFVVNGLTVNGAAPLSPWATTYTSNVAMAHTGSGVDNGTITIGTDDPYLLVKAGASSSTGTIVVTVPTGTTDLHFHAFAWGGKTAKIELAGVENASVSEFDLAGEAGASGSGNDFTLQGDPVDQYFHVSFDAVAAETEITFSKATGSADNRFFFYGVNQEGGVLPVLESIEISGDLNTKTGYKVGDALDLDGLTVEATYSLGGVAQSPVDITSDPELELTYDPLVEDQTEVTITASYKGQTDDITITGLDPVASADPKIYVSTLNVNFASVEVGESVPAAETVTVTLTNVASVTATLGGTNADAFSVSPASLTESGDITISILANTDAAASYAATLTISDGEGGADDKTVNLSFEVTEPVSDDDVSGTWTLVTNATTLAAGKKVIIAQYVEADGAINTMASQSSNNRSVIASTVAGATLTPAVGTKVMTLADADEGNFYLKTSDGEYLYNASTSSKSYLRTKAEEENVSWTIAVDAEGVATITSVENTNRTKMRYNPNTSGSPLFNCYASGQEDIALYMLEEDAPEPPTPDYTEVRNGLNAGEYYTMCLDKAVTDVRGGSIWRVLSKAENGKDIILEEVEGMLDAGRPYIFYATAATLEVAYTGAAVSTPVDEGNNGLIGSFSQVKIANDPNNYIIYNNALYFVNSDNVYVGEHRAYLNMGGVPPYSNEPQQGNAPRRRVTMAVHGPQVATGMDALNASDAPVKVLINGQLFILRGEKMYNVNGQLVK